MFWEMAPGTGGMVGHWEPFQMSLFCNEEFSHSQCSSALIQSVVSFSWSFVWSTQSQVQNTAFWVLLRGASEDERKRSSWCKASPVSAAAWPKRRDLGLLSCALPLRGLHTLKLWGFWCFNNVLCQISFWRASLCLFSFLWAYCSSPWQNSSFCTVGHCGICSARKITMKVALWIGKNKVRKAGLNQDPVTAHLLVPLLTSWDRGCGLLLSTQGMPGRRRQHSSKATKVSVNAALNSNRPLKGSFQPSRKRREIHWGGRWNRCWVQVQTEQLLRAPPAQISSHPTSAPLHFPCTALFPHKNVTALKAEQGRRQEYLGSSTEKTDLLYKLCHLEKFAVFFDNK